MNNLQTQNDVINFIASLSIENVSQDAINHTYAQFLEIVNAEMKRSLPEIKSKVSGKTGRKKCPFWGENLSRLFKAAAQAEKRFCKPGAVSGSMEKRELHQDLKVKQKEFDNAFRKAKRTYSRQSELEIESMVNTDGKQMWRKLESLGPKNLKNKIPEEVTIDGARVASPHLVLDKWKRDFSQGDL